ncbi:MAG: hypothetical protein EOO14_17120, partial [Chitinophagaceae bacterium]
MRTLVCEKLTAVKHCNGRDIWVIVHAFNSASFLSFPVTSAGVGTPVISTTGTVVTGSDNSIGCMKVSPNGRKIAAAHKRLGVDLLDFDNSTGIVSNGQPLLPVADPYRSGRGAYGVEFSPSSKLLYVSGDYFNFSTSKENSYLLQYNVQLPDITSVRASRFIVYDDQQHWYAENFGTLQNGPDGKMYLAEMSQPAISVINHPNTMGAACNFVKAQFQTWHNAGGISMYGLPGFVQSYLSSTFSFRGACNGTVLSFDYERGAGEISVKWDFGDPASGANNTATADSVQHSFSTPGIYTVKLVRFTSCGQDTISRQVNAGGTTFTLGQDTLLCGVSQYTLNPAAIGANNVYLWQDGTKNATFTAANSGLYWVQVTDTLSGCSKRDSIALSFKPIPQFSLGPDQNRCSGNIVSLNSSVTGGIYAWSNGTSTASIQVNNSGTYW